MNRRVLIKSSLLGVLATSLPNIIFANKNQVLNYTESNVSKYSNRYPSIDDEIVADIVGSSHFNLEHVKELVDVRPELSRATWDWAFGDWETAIGAASHVGRRDIVEYLMSKGARPDIFTFTMLGNHEAVKSIIENNSGIQKIEGPHGISLLSHAKISLRSDTSTLKQKEDLKKVIEFLEEQGDADGNKSFIPLTEEEQEKYLGDYKYGEGENDGFSIKKNMRKLLSLGRLGKFGGAINQIAENEFLYNGTSTVKISFEFNSEKIIALTVSEPGFVLKANKV